MKVRSGFIAQLVTVLLFCGVGSAQDQEARRMPTWQDEISKGFVPYHQLTADDFRIDDKAHPEAAYWIKSFLHPYWHYIFTQRDWYYAYVDQWTVFSGLDKNETTRLSKERKMKERLPHAQAYLDLNEIYARQLAALKPGELPSGRGATPEEAGKELYQKMDAFLKERSKAFAEEAEQFQKATDRGANMKKVRELGKAIRKRLDAIPAPSGPAYALPVPTPSASPSGSVGGSISAGGLKPPL